MRFEKKLNVFFRKLLLYLPVILLIVSCMFANQPILETLDDFRFMFFDNMIGSLLLLLLDYLGFVIPADLSYITFEIYLIFFVGWYILVHVMFLVIDLFTLPLHWGRMLFEKGSDV